MHHRQEVPAGEGRQHRSNRENLQNIWVSKRHAMATDGKILALVPITFDKDDETGWMTPDALKLAKESLRERF